MRIAAGVLLIVTAILNVVVGCGWAGAGACTGCVGEVLDQYRVQEENQWNDGDVSGDSSSYPNEEEGNETDANDAESNDSAWGEGTSDYEEFEEFDPTDQETIDELKTSGAGMALYGFAIMILAGVMIGAAICAFQAKKANFVMITGILSIVAELMGGLLLYSIFPEVFIIPEQDASVQDANFIWSIVKHYLLILLPKLPGVLAGVFSIIAARSFPHPFLGS